MLNRSSHLPNAHELGKLRQAVETMKPAAPPRQPGRRLRDETGGVLLLAAILVAACACLLLLDRLGVPPAAMTDFPLVD